MNYDEMVELKGKVDAVRNVLNKVGLQDREIDKVFADHVPFEKASFELSEITENEVEHWLYCRGKATDKMWEYWEATGESRTTECRMLRQAAHVLREAWRTRIGILSKKVKG